MKPERDGDKLGAWLRADLENAHRVLDGWKVPRRLPDSRIECTLAARIEMALRLKLDLG